MDMRQVGLFFLAEEHVQKRSWPVFAQSEDFLSSRWGWLSVSFPRRSDSGALGAVPPHRVGRSRATESLLSASCTDHWLFPYLFLRDALSLPMGRAAFH